MNIAIIGGGSLGLLFAHYLNEYHQVCVYVRSKDQKDSLSNRGLVFEKNGQQTTTPIKSEMFSEWKGNEELTIVAVKQYHLQQVLKNMVEASPFYDGAYLFLQNGMGHLKWLAELKAKHIYVGSVEHGANKINSNHVKHTGDGVTRLAIYYGQSFSIMDEINDKRLDKNFRITYEKDYEEMLVRKLIVNAVVNPLTAVLNVRNGELLENPHFYRIFQKMFKEVSVILNITEVEESFCYVKNICKKTAANRSSMLQDLDSKRPTEVDAILGYVLEKAGEMGVDAPLTEIFYQSIKGKEY
ncbi:2-dehydropantoate 2-reductase [Bacillus sp. S/N-304-OC-R1]|uniref:2-dehydropantoate 2-reductase n=1 Tax=Bacillus sp. S/N-304-OC-R1 TaxID=2758034 RepID=UPI001C8E4DB4|nr:2-dehydropantoate 2-reductase [Bacillus sp. S/N-304-OC-R1]MBY0120804.1 2-dehydropantoate 2-reductase [Bacillus sp. S/N-304-OC-R1]